METTSIAIPEPLQRLPVASKLQTIDFGLKHLLVRAATGAGKTMVIPPVEATMKKRAGAEGVVAVRIPTKAAGGFLYSGLKELWSPLGLKVSILNRDIEKGSDEEKAVKDADLVIISDGSLKRLLGLTKVYAYYPDECHSLSLAAELDIAIAKMKGIPLRLMSATVDPRMFLDYLGEGAGNYVLEGRQFPIQKKSIFSHPDIFTADGKVYLDAVVETACATLLQEKKSGLFFLKTRQMCEDYAKQFGEMMDCQFVHGNVNPVDAEKWLKERVDRPTMTFSTTALIAGVTLNIDNVWICDERIDSEVVRGVEHIKTIPMPDNDLLQGCGRVGRLRPGDAYLITHERNRPKYVDPWSTVSPRPIVAPSTKSTPFEVVMTLSANGITEDKDIDLLGKLTPDEINHARDWLVRHGCLESDGGLTVLGRRVQSFPLETRRSHLVLSAPSKQAQVALLAFFCLGDDGAFGLVKLKPGKEPLFKRRQEQPDYELLPSHLVVPNSAPLTFAKVMQAVVPMATGYIYRWCETNDMWPKPFFGARKDFIEAGKQIAGASAEKVLSAIQFDQPFVNEVHMHIKRSDLFSCVETDDVQLVGGGLLDGVFADVFRVRGRNRAWGIVGWRTSQRGKTFRTLDNPIIEPRHQDLPPPAYAPNGLQAVA